MYLLLLLNTRVTKSTNILGFRENLIAFFFIDAKIVVK